MEFTYKFPAIKGIQANQEYYTIMVPLKLLSKIFIFNDELEELPPEFRAQRNLNKNRVPEIGQYILENLDTYVFSSLTASVDGDIKFEAISGKDIGYLNIDMSARFLINDGQHRKASIEYALSHNDELKNETISIVLFKDKELKRSQQMFSDLNRYAITPTKSIGILYDSRDDMANLTKEVISKVELFKRHLDKEKSSLPKYSSKAFTLSNVYQANLRIIGKKDKDKDFIIKFWKCVFENIEELADLKEKKIRPADLRKSYIVTYGTFLEAMGVIANSYYPNNYKKLELKLKNLKGIDWSKENKDWSRRIISENGRVVKNLKAIKLTASLIKKKIKISLNKEEEQLEKEFKKNGK